MRHLALGLVAGLLAVGTGATVVGAQGEHASGTFVDGQGTQVGTVTMEPAAGGVRLQVSARNLAPGEHGIHVHAVGSCQPPAFASAGAHFNPTGTKHGLQNPEGPHAGDLPNLTADNDGKTFYTATTARFMLSDLADADGSAVVIHARADDQMTDPAGNSGDRVACAVLTVTKAGQDKGAPPGMPRTGAGGGDVPASPLIAASGLLVLAGLAARRRRG